MYEELKKLANDYFIAFENKDIEFLDKLFSDDIVLFDPIVKEIVGKENVLQVNKDIFSNCKKLEFIKKDIFIDSNKMSAIGELEFYCDDTKINVVDIIKFNDNLKITSIVAYLDSKSLG